MSNVLIKAPGEFKRNASFLSAFLLDAVIVLEISFETYISSSLYPHRSYTFVAGKQRFDLAFSNQCSKI